MLSVCGVLFVESDGVGTLQAKKEIYDVKQQRLYLAQDEYNHLNNVLSTLNTSRTSCEYCHEKYSNSTLL